MLLKQKSILRLFFTNQNYEKKLLLYTCTCFKNYSAVFFSKHVDEKLQILSLLLSLNLWASITHIKNSSKVAHFFPVTNTR